MTAPPDSSGSTRSFFKRHDIKPIDAIAYPVALGYIAGEELIRFGAWLTDKTIDGARHTSKSVWAYAKNMSPEKAQKIEHLAQETYDHANKTISQIKSGVSKTLRSMSPRKSFAIVAGVATTAYVVSPLAGMYLTVFGSPAMKAAAMVVPKTMQFIAAGTIYMCWDNAKKCTAGKWTDEKFNHLKDIGQEIKDWAANTSLGQKIRSFFPQQATEKQSYRQIFTHMATALPGIARMSELRKRLRSGWTSATQSKPVITTTPNIAAPVKTDMPVAESTPIVRQPILSVSEHLASLRPLWQVMHSPQPYRSERLPMAPLVADKRAVMHFH